MITTADKDAKFNVEMQKIKLTDHRIGLLKWAHRDSIFRGMLENNSQLMVRYPCGRGLGIDIPFEECEKAPQETIQEAANKLKIGALKHMSRCRKGCKDAINTQRVA